MAFVLGQAAGDAVLVSTGQGGSTADEAAKQFWAEYHHFLGIRGFSGNERPDDLTPLDYSPAQLALRKFGFKTTARHEWEVAKPLTFEKLLSWIEHGALTSLLALGDHANRGEMAEHMRNWLRKRSVPLHKEWIFHGGVQMQVMFRT
jgi:hypothetical protein